MKFKKYYPFIFPAIALILVLFLAFRWYNLRTQRNQQEEQESPLIENLTEEEMEQIVQGDESVQTIELEGEGTGQVRYTITDDRVLFSVSANLDRDAAGTYQVWIQQPEAAQADKAFILDYGKGGFMGSASVPADQLPFDLVISLEENVADDTLEQEILRAAVTAQE